MIEQPDPTYEEIEAAILAADDAFWNNPAIVFGAESEQKRLLFEHLKRLSRSWDRAGPCMYRGCTKRSIRRSHTIHRAGPLEHIAEDQHVLTPLLDSHGQIKMERIGVNLASTFPGFCVDHEQLFSDFETVGSISSERHVALQAYRTLCREIARKHHLIRGLERLLDQYRNARQNHYSGAIQKDLPGTKFQSLSIKGDRIEKRLATVLKGATADLAELTGDLHDQYFAYINGGSQEPSLKVLSIPFDVPVSLSGFGVLTYKRKRDKRTRRALCILGILPQGASTIVFIGANRRDDDIVEAYSSSMVDGFNGLNAMESWMTNGTDHWFIRPSAWAAVPQHRQEKVLELLMSEEDNIGKMLQFSILDEFRRTVIAFVHEHIDEAPNPLGVLAMVNKEAAKLA